MHKLQIVSTCLQCTRNRLEHTWQHQKWQGRFLHSHTAENAEETTASHPTHPPKPPNMTPPVPPKPQGCIHSVGRDDSQHFAHFQNSPCSTLLNKHFPFNPSLQPSITQEAHASLSQDNPQHVTWRARVNLQGSISAHRCRMHPRCIGAIAFPLHCYDSTGMPKVSEHRHHRPLKQGRDNMLTTPAPQQPTATQLHCHTSLPVQATCKETAKSPPAPVRTPLPPSLLLQMSHGGKTP